MTPLFSQTVVVQITQFLSVQTITSCIFSSIAVGYSISIDDPEEVHKSRTDTEIVLLVWSGCCFFSPSPFPDDKARRDNAQAGNAGFRLYGNHFKNITEC